ncbi:Ig-like domain-containing protein, partial [Vibrio splendidus]|uniref:Ig-like domain-containing protein n=1 Tax=Vibrio splendidus TaxID=29497 RepID=UPI000D4EEEFB
MIKVQVSSINDITVTGFDITVRKPNGETQKIPNGVTSLLKGDLIISGIDGSPLLKSDIFKKVNLESNSSVLVPTMINSQEEVVDENYKIQQDGEPASTQSQEELEALQEQIKELTELKRQLEEAKEEDEASEEQESNLELLNELLNQTNYAFIDSQMLQANEDGEAESEQNDNTSTNSSNEQPSINTSSSSGTNSQPITEGEGESDKEESTLFVEVQLSSRSDSGTKGDFITNLSKPTFEVRTLAGATVSISINGVIYEAVADSSGFAIVTTSGELADGEYNLIVKAVDDAGNEESINQLLVIDTDPPEVTIRLDSDTGHSEVDGITNVNRPTFKGTVGGNPESLTITVGDISYELPVNNGEWSFTFPVEIPDGTHEFIISAIDAAGNEATASQQVVIDTVNDFSVSLTGLTDSGMLGDWVTNIDRPIFVFKHEAGSTIEITLNGITYEVDVNESSPTNYQLPISLTEGVHHLTFVSIDVAGNRSEIEQEVIIDLTPPQFTWLGLSDESNTGDITDNVTAVTNPIFVGRGEIGATILVEIDGFTYSTKVDDSGRWSLSVSNNLSDGTYIISAHATDVAGNASEVVGTEVVIDTVGPTITGGLDSSTDTGQYNNDGITNAETLIFKGETEPNLLVTLFIEELNYSTAVDADAQGNWGFDVSNLEEGNYSYFISAVDAAGNDSVNAVKGTIVVDRSIDNFSAQISDESNSGDISDNITNVKTPTFSGTAEPSSKITVTIKNVSTGDKPSVYGPVTTDDSGHWFYSVPSELSDGDYLVSFSVLDLAGNTDSVDFTIVIDTQISLTAELNSTSDSAEVGDLITNVSRPEFNGTSDPGSTVYLLLTHAESGAKVELTTIALADGSWSIVTPVSSSLSNQGEWSWVVNAVDVAGNNADPVSGSFLFDSIAPGVIVELASSTGFDELHTNDNTLNFLIKTEANAKVSVSIFQVTNSVISTTPIYESAAPILVGDSGQLVYNVTTPLADGEYAYQVSSTDVAGNVSVTELNSVTIDTAPPELGIITLTDNSDSNLVGDNITNESNLILKGVGSEVGSLIHITITNNRTGEILTLDPSNYKVESANWIYELPQSLEDGSYNLSFQAEDSAGNTSAHGDLEVIIDTVPPELGSVTLDSNSDTGISDGDFITQDRNPIFVGSAEKNSTVEVLIYRSDTLIKSSSVKVTDQNGLWSVTVSDLSDGEYRWVVKATDIAGNTATLAEDDQLLTIDTIYQGATGKLNDDSNSGDKLDNITNHHGVKLSGTGEVGSSAQIKSLTGPDGSNIDISAVPNTVVNESGDWVLQLPGLIVGEGNYQWTVELIDLAGNSKNLSGTVVLDTITNIDAILESDFGVSDTDGITNAKSPTFSGTGEVGGVVELTIVGPDGRPVVNIPTTTVASNGKWSITIPELSKEGDYSWYAEVTDVAGNTASTNVSTFTLDMTAPNILGAKVVLDNSIGFESEPIRTNNDQPTFEGKISESNGVVVVHLYSVIDGGVSPGPIYTSDPTNIDSKGGFSVSVSDSLSEGEFLWTLEVSDIAGNKTNSDPQTIVIDKTAPTLSDVSLSDDSDTSLVAGSNHSNDSTPTFVGLSEAGARVSIRV